MTGVQGSNFSSGRGNERSPRRRRGRAALDRIDLVRRHVEADAEARAQRVGGARRDLEAHGVAEAAATQLVLDRLEEVVRLVRDLEVGVARYAERGMLDDLHPREEPLEEVRDDVLGRDQEPALPDREEARQHLGELHAREALVRGARVVGQQSERERQARDVGEAPSGPDAERRQHRVDRPLVRPGQLGELGARAVGNRADDDALPRQLGDELLPPEPRLGRGQLEDALAQGGQRLGGGHPVREARREPCGRLAEQPGDADHEELVEVRGEDRDEEGPLQQRQLRVLPRARAPGR